MYSNVQDDFKHLVFIMTKKSFWPFIAWCSIKGHTYLNLLLKADGFFKSVRPFSG